MQINVDQEPISDHHVERLASIPLLRQNNGDLAITVSKGETAKVDSMHTSSAIVVET